MPPIFIAPMPTVRSQGGQAQPGPSQGAQQPPAARTTFRPPWIKDGPEPLPMPAAPWTLSRVRDRRTSRDEAPAKEPQPPPGRKQSKITIVPSQPQPQENGVDSRDVNSTAAAAAAAAAPNKQQAAPTKPAEEPPQERKISIQVESKQKPQPKEEPGPRPQPREEPKPQPKQEAKAPKEESPRERKLDIQVASRQKDEPKTRQEPPKEKKTDASMPPKPKEAKEAKEAKAAPRERRPPEPQLFPLQRNRTSSASLAPAPPPMPPPAPPLPPPPDFKKTPLSEEQAKKVAALRNRPRKRPDWGAMMKELEQGRKLKHVQCNDRSQPLLPCVKVKEQFMYESEKPNVHNLLLREIQSGVKLKRVQTNDRSKPMLQGLRKFRRQLTIEEQQQQAEPVVVVEEDELDDIDKLRDDLQSTKQMLALELRNKEAVEKENKRLQARILNLEVELDQERKQKATQERDLKKSEEEKETQKLREDLSAANKHTHELEQRCHEADLQLDLLRAELEELRMRNATLERRTSSSKVGQPISKQPSNKRLASSHDIPTTKLNNANVIPTNEEEDEEEEESEYEEETESEEEDSSEDEEKAAALREKRNARELRLLATKVTSLKEKEETARKERHALRMQLKNQQKALKEELRKFKKLQKEVDKMARLMKEDDEEEEDEDEEEDEEEEEEESEESSSEESEEEESEGELPPESPFDERKKHFADRAKRHENLLAALKKGNYLLKANVEKVKDDLFKQKELSLSLQEDLNSVLAELG